MMRKPVPALKTLRCFPRTMWRGRSKAGRTIALVALSLGWLAPPSAQAQFQVLKVFPLDGSDRQPSAALVKGDDGNLYGTTYGGYSGYSDRGTVFKISSDGSTFSTLHSFAGSDGANPYAALVKGDDGNLYGTTPYGGAYGSGTVFKISPDGSTFSTLRSFNFADSDGIYPSSALAKGDDGNFYGTTYSGGPGGAYSVGTVFKISPDGSTFSTLHAFDYSDGANPNASLVKGDDGNFYGTTTYGGARETGTVFKISPDGSSFSTLHTFDFTNGYYNGAYLNSSLVKGDDGNFYGTTVTDDPYGAGTVFKISPDGSTFSTLHGFAGDDGAAPYAALIQACDGNFYGTTQQGGAYYSGTVFKISPDGSSFSTLHNFDYSDGAYPNASLVNGDDGNFYSTTHSGGAGVGVVFRLTAPILPSIPTIISSGSGGNVTLTSSSATSYLWSTGATTQSITV